MRWGRKQDKNLFKHIRALEKNNVVSFQEILNLDLNNKSNQIIALEKVKKL